MKKYDDLNKFVKHLSRFVSFFVFLILSFIVLYVLIESVPFIRSEFSLSFVSLSWRPLSTPPSFGILPMLLGTLYVAIFASLIAFPVAVGCAGAISSCFTGKTKHMLLGLIDMLAGIHSVVYGILGFYILVKPLEKTALMATGESILAAIITLALMIVPYMVSAFAKAFERTNENYQMSAKALGVSQWYSLTHLSLAHCKLDLLSGFLVALSKALGETMAVMMVIGNSPLLPKLLGKGITISSLIALEMGSAKLGCLHYHALYTAGMLLLILLLSINGLVRFIERRAKK